MENLNMFEEYLLEKYNELFLNLEEDNVEEVLNKLNANDKKRLAEEFIYDNISNIDNIDNNELKIILGFIVPNINNINNNQIELLKEELHDIIEHDRKVISEKAASKIEHYIENISAKINDEDIERDLKLLILSIKNNDRKPKNEIESELFDILLKDINNSLFEEMRADILIYIDSNFLSDIRNGKYNGIFEYDKNGILKKIY